MTTSAEEFLAAARGYTTGTIKGATVDAIGAPVDLINELILRPIFGNRVSNKPVGGSKQLRELFGVGVEDANLAETAGGLVSPTGAAKAMIVLAARLGTAGKTADTLRKGKLSEGTIFQNTGTYKEAGGKKSKAVISDDSAEVTEAFKAAKAFKVMSLPAVLSHPSLYELYPELKKVTVSKDLSSEAAFVPRYGHIRIGEGVDGEQLRKALLHETQHAVQKADKTQGGGSVESLMYDLALPYDRAFKEYYKLAGEQEARFTEATGRMNKRQIEEEVLKLLRQGKTPANSQ